MRIITSTVAATSNTEPKRPAAGPASTQPVASSRPIVSGAMPCVKARTPRVSRRLAPHRVAHSDSAVDGMRMPAMVASAPSGPPTFQPITATNSTFGPGAACAIATEAVNCGSVIQWC